MLTTTSLETSKLLKENGFRQDSDYSWAESSSVMSDRLVHKNALASCRVKDWYSAPTTDELLEWLPANIKTYSLQIIKTPNGFHVSYTDFDYSLDMLYEGLNGSLPEALAQMWLGLKKEELL